MLLKDHYTGKTHEYKVLSHSEILNLDCVSHALIISNNGDVVRVKINGKVKTWKRSPERWEVPVKYGLYECVTIENTNNLNIFVKEVL